MSLNLRAMLILCIYLWMRRKKNSTKISEVCAEFLRRLKSHERYYKFPCLGGGYNGPLIGFDGTVFPCCAWNTPLGNVKEQPFSRIWKSKKAKEARLKIKRRLCPVCYHHTRTFDFLFFAPRLFKNAKTLLKGYKIISRM